MTWWSDTGRIGADLDSVRLEPGAHRSPRDGVCLLELTSILAQEKFSDRPRCVCVVVAAFLRDWNDRSGHAQRQLLRPYAKRVIGSRAGRGVTRRRRDICLIWGGADLSGRWVSRAMRRTAMRLRILAILGIRPALRLNEGAGQLAARVVFSRYDSRTGLGLVETLLEVGSELEPAAGAGDDGRDGEALARAVVESAVRSPVPLTLDGESSSANGGNGHANGHGNDHVNGTRPAAETPERVPADA
jgi:hypothetical protein